MTDYTNKLTVLVPEALKDISNNLAAASGLSEYDLGTFNHAGYEDSENNKYCVISTMVTDAFLEKIGEPLVRPAFDVDHLIDMTKAAEAQALIRFNADDVLNFISAGVNVDPFEFIASAGLTLIPIDLGL